MTFNPLHPLFIQMANESSMAIVSNRAPCSTTKEASYILIIKESIRLITADSVIRTSLKGPEAITLLA